MADPGLSRGCYSAPRRRVSISMTTKPAATIAAFKFSVSAKSAAALRNSRKVLIRLSGFARAVRRFGALDGKCKWPGAKPAGAVSEGRPRRASRLELPSHPVPSQHSGLRRDPSKPAGLAFRPLALNRSETILAHFSLKSRRSKGGAHEPPGRRHGGKGSAVLVSVPFRS